MGYINQKTVPVSRADAIRRGMPIGCRFGVISEGCTGYWGWGRNQRTAWTSARRYLRAENGWGFEESVEKMPDCWIEEITQ